jgi:lantibiotic modifying enzyme
MPARATAKAALAMGRMIAARVTDHERLAAAMAAAVTQTRYPSYAVWDAPSVTQGNAGQAMLCAYLDSCFPDEGWDRVAHDHLMRAVRVAERRPRMSPSIFGGISGIALTAALLARDGTRYRRLRHSLDARLLPDVFAGARALAAASAGMPVSQFDLISGLAGVAAYLLRPTATGESSAALEPALQGLATLAQVIDGRPRWHTPPYLMHDEGMARQYPQGNLNLGLAHGIPGPLAVMSMGLLQGHEHDGVRSAVQTLATWLMEWRCDDEWGVNWPTVVDLRAIASRSGDGIGPGPSRAAWCYGSPGVARALWLAGCALGDEAAKQTAVEGMTAIYRRPIAERRINSPTFCHGIAGLLQVTTRFAADTGLPVFAEAAQTLTRQLLATCDPCLLLGVANTEQDGTLVDQPGVLDGATGVAMTLLAVGTGVEPAWDRLFALA